MNQIKNSYNPVYKYTFGKCVIDPKRKDFFRNKDIF